MVSCTDTPVKGDGLSFRGRLSSVTESELDRRVVKASSGGAELTIIRTARPMDELYPTKGSVLTSLEGRSFSLNGFQYSASESWEDVKGRVSPSSFFYDRTMTFVPDGSLLDGDMVFRGGASKRMAFFGMGPQDVDFPAVLVSGASKAGAPEYEVTCPMVLEDQYDLVECAVVDVSGGGQDGVVLSFSHALSGIRFCFDDFGADVFVYGLYIGGFHTEGIRCVGEGWTLPEDPEDLGWLDYDLDLFVPSSGECFLFDGQPVYVIPQEMGSSSYVELYMDVCGDIVRFVCPLDGLVFEAGKVYTLNFSVDPGDFLYNVLAVDVLSGSGSEGGSGEPELSSFGPSVPLVLSSLTKAGTSTVPEHLADVENLGAVVYSYKLYSSGLKRALPWEVQSYSLIVYDDVTGEESMVTVDSLEDIGVTVLTDSGLGNPYGDPFCFIYDGDYDGGSDGGDDGTKAGSGSVLYDSSCFLVNVMNSDGEAVSFVINLNSVSGPGGDGGGYER